VANALGEVADLEIADGDGAISEIYLADGRKLPVDPAEFTIGPDQVVVPETYATRIVDTGEQEEGFWARLGQNMRSALAFHGGVLPADVFDDEPETDSRSAGGHA